MKLSEVFNSQESHASGAVMFVDMSDSTAMKEQESEATWLTTYAWFFDLVRDNVIETEGHIVKYLGDGAMVYYEMKNVANAINAAIKIQEELKKADRNKRVYITCSIGISTGKFRTFQTPEGVRDYIGSVVDRAARLGSSASAMAIFVDRSTINSAMMINVESKLGELLDWGVDDYTGNQQKISLKGFNQPVLYHEIKWDQQLYGIKSDVVTDAAEEHVKRNPIAPDVAIEPVILPAKTGVLTTGVVKRWIADRNFGFISSKLDGEEFYTNLQNTHANKALIVEQEVMFIPHDSIGNSKYRLAHFVVLLGEKYSGLITRLSARDSAKQIATISIFDTNNSSIDFFAFLGTNQNQLAKGDTVEFYAAQNEKGPRANNPVKTIRH